MNVHAYHIVFLAFLLPIVSAFIPGSNPGVRNTPSVFRLPVTQATAEAGIPTLPNLAPQTLPDDAAVPPLPGQPKAPDDTMMGTRRQFMTTAAVAATIFAPTSALAKVGNKINEEDYDLLKEKYKAKGKYLDKVKKGATAYLALDLSLGAEDPYFKGNLFNRNVAEDFLTSGPLLADAFRSSKKSASEKLPTVKKWNAFLTEYEAFLKSSKEADGADAAAQSLKSSKELLKNYLKSVDVEL